MKPCGRCGLKPTHAVLRWGAVLALGAALEAEGMAAKRHTHTLSHATRSVFRTETSCGRKIFTVVWVLLAFTFERHIRVSHHNYPRCP